MSLDSLSLPLFVLVSFGLLLPLVLPALQDAKVPGSAAGTHQADYSENKRTIPAAFFALFVKRWEFVKVDKQIRLRLIYLWTCSTAYRATIAIKKKQK